MRPSPSADRVVGAGLRAMQTRFLTALRDGQDVLQVAGQDVFLEPPGDTISARWTIYREGYLIRLAEAIQNDYPALARIVGPSAFAGLCRRYVAECPPSSHDIGRAGASLAGYLPADPVTTRLPFLPDLARLEWALAEAVVARDEAPLSWSDVEVLGAERVVDVPLLAMPGTAIIRSEWPLSDLWLAKDKEDGEIDIVVEGPPATLLVWRDGLDARWRAAEMDEAALIEGALCRSTPTSLLESGAFGAGDDAPLRLVAALRRLVELGTLAPLTQEEDP